MKNPLTIVTLAVLTTTSAMAGYHVSTEQQQRHAVLEEFTGIHCLYCPQAHKIAAELLEAYPDQMEVICIHYGSFARAAYDDQPDFNTEDGDVLGNYYHAESFPIGMINRRELDGRVLTSRSQWEGQVAEVTAEVTPVNIWTSSRYDVATGLLTVDVEGYIHHADADTQAPLYLAVALTQDSILGPQQGGLMGDEYPHNHVLRDYLTPVWGEELGQLSVGSYFTRHYEYQVPASYKNTDVDYRQLTLVTFVTNAEREIVNATHSQPTTSTWHVGTAPEPRHVLIEDFTGVLCGNCPDGDAVIENVMLAQPDLVHGISIHTGHYAEPQGSALPDYRSEAGDAIADHFQPDGFPSGMINRRNIDGTGVVTGRGVWVAQARKEAHTTAPVNLWMQSTYSAQDRTLSIDVEGYALETGTRSLAIALTQNHLIGHQSGARNQTSYDHSRVLRDYVTPVWGDPLGEVEAGSYFSRHYDYVLPADYRGQAVVPEDVELTAIVTDPDSSIVNCLTVKPMSADFTPSLRFELEPYKVMPTRNWGFNFVEAYLLNLGTDEITSATFDISLNEQPARQASWSGTIPGRQRGMVTLPVDWLSTQDDDRNDYVITITAVNGTACEPQSIEGSFNALIDVEGNVVVKIKEDYYASDNRFLLRDTTGMVLYETGPFPDSTKQVTYVDTLRLEPGRIYGFDISDSWGNGIMSPRGNIKWYNEAGSLIAQQPEFSAYGYRIFFRTAAKAPESIETLRADAADTATRYEWRDGQLVVRNMITGSAYSLSGFVIP